MTHLRLTLCTRLRLLCRRRLHFHVLFFRCLPLGTRSNSHRLRLFYHGLVRRLTVLRNECNGLRWRTLQGCGGWENDLGWRGLLRLLLLKERLDAVRALRYWLYERRGIVSDISNLARNRVPILLMSVLSKSNGAGPFFTSRPRVHTVGGAFRVSRSTILSMDLATSRARQVQRVQRASDRE